jgi:DNA-binding XRE family transcriptional regulator
MSTKMKYTAGQKLWQSLLQADAYDQEAGKVNSPAGAPRTNPHRATKKWMEGKSRSLKDRFSSGLRAQRERQKLTQDQLAERAGLTVTAVAMIERGERLPSVDTAARLCWALDMAAGITRADL